MVLIIASYAMAIGLLMLAVPIAVQELVSTFSFAVQPIMVYTLALIVTGMLTGVAAFRVLQARAVETLSQRVYTRIALAFTNALPRMLEPSFLPQHAHRFAEADSLTRALVAMIADLFNVAVVGTIGMTMLMVYHPYFVLYDIALLTGFVVLLAVFGRGGFLITLEMSRLNYEIFNWIQNVSRNLPHLRAIGESPFLLRKTDDLTQTYVRIRQQRSDILTGRQYKVAALWQVVGHSGLIVTAGLLVVDGQLTVGQFVAAELIVGNLLLNMDTLARRMVHVFFALVSFRELAGVFRLPQDSHSEKVRVPFSRYAEEGLRVTCRNLSYTPEGKKSLFQNFDMEVAPGEKVAVLCQNSTMKTILAKLLAGLSSPSTGVVRYNDMNLVEISLDTINECRGLVLDSHPTLLEATIEENLTLGRASITYDDIQWALHFAELDAEVDAMPQGMTTLISATASELNLSQILRLLVARAVVIRPRLLILDGTLYGLVPALREVILRRMCSKEEPWTVIFVTDDPHFDKHVDHRIVVSNK
ncbi:MAG: ATP-binding cassette domain-containing protein [Nitrospiraceae bacterium]